jgi:hypothetical protein
MDEKKTPQDTNENLTPEMPQAPLSKPEDQMPIPTEVEQTQSLQPARPPMPISSPELKPVKKPKRIWRDLLIAVGILQVVLVTSYIQITNQITQDAKDGASGMEFVAILIFFTYIPAMIVLIIINIIGLSIYLFKRRPKGIGLAFGVVSLLISSTLFSIGAYSYIRSSLDTTPYVDESSRVVFPEWAAEGETEKDITKDQAISLIRKCDIYYVYYKDQAN